MNANPLVSIIVPIYNVEKYLKRAVDSILLQTYEYLEVILIDDGSTDLSPLICDEYAKCDNRVKVIHKANGGISDARNTGLCAASGALIYWVDSDDYIEINTIEKMVNCMMETGSDMVCCGLNLIDENGKKIGERSIDAAVMSDRDETIRNVFAEMFPFNYPCNKLCQKSLYNQIFFPFQRLYEDIAVIYKVVYNAKKIYYLDDCLYNYIQRQGSITSELNSDKAAKSYYDGCQNAVERILFCKSHFKDMSLTQMAANQFYTWAKLCLEKSIRLGINTYMDYHKRIMTLVNSYGVDMNLRLKWILRFPRIYFYLYPILGRNK